MRVVVAGAGVFGATCALTCRERGHEVVLVDPGPLPHPDAASTDLSKLVRMDYGANRFYTAQMERALEGWRSWNQTWPRPLFHEEGMLVLSHTMEAGSFEGDSLRVLDHRGHAVRPVRPGHLTRDFPHWRGFDAGYFNPVAGWAESGAVVAALLERAMALGVVHRAARVLGLLGEDPVCGLLTTGGTLEADVVVVAPGCWLGGLLPELADRVRAVGQPVLHFAPPDPDGWRAPQYPPWAADIANTGWYGFPANADGIVKVANHGPGRVLDPDGPREVDPSWEARFRAFFRAHLPALADAPLVGSRLCVYADSFDGDFFIGRHPARSGLVVSGGGSGHGFKFAPLLGAWAAACVEGGEGPARFGLRELGERRTEDARHDG